MGNRTSFTIIFIVLMMVSTMSAQPTQPAATQPTEQEVQQLLADGRKVKLDRTKELQEIIRKSKRDSRKRTEAEAEIKWLRTQNPFIPLLKTLQIGKMGRLDNNLTIPGGAWKTNEQFHGIIEVSQVVDDNNTLGYVGISDPQTWENRTLVWVKGFKHQKADGQDADAGFTVFRVTERKQYQTSGAGLKTVFVIEPIDLAPYLQQQKR